MKVAGHLIQPGQPGAEGIALGKLKGNIGNQNDEIPDGTDLMAYSRAVLWCRAFNVAFGTATLGMGSSRTTPCPERSGQGGVSLR